MKQLPAHLQEVCPVVYSRNFIVTRRLPTRQRSDISATEASFLAVCAADDVHGGAQLGQQLGWGKGVAGLACTAARRMGRTDQQLMRINGSILYILMRFYIKRA
jgi:hypothetical protein